MNEKDFKDINIYTGEMKEIAQPTTPQQQELMSVEQSRAVAEVQAAMLVARMNPRDEFQSYQKIMKACKRKTLAESAAYAYPRGGKMVTGPSIRLAETLARIWENITYGMRELSRKDGYSEVQAFAWDLETNTRVVRDFTVKHIREKQSGNVALTGERDIYELMANMGQRRVRACILALVPGDIVESAIKQCEETLKKGERPISERIADMVDAFGDMGITQDMIEKRLGHPLTAIKDIQFVELIRIYSSIKDGMADKEKFFGYPTEEIDNIAETESSLTSSEKSEPEEIPEESVEDKGFSEFNESPIDTALRTAKEEKADIQEEQGKDNKAKEKKVLRAKPKFVEELCKYLDDVAPTLREAAMARIREESFEKLTDDDKDKIVAHFNELMSMP